MPTILRIGPYRFFFYAGDRDEPLHIHVERDDNVTKFWLAPIRLQNSGGFKRREINRIHRIIEENHDQLVEGWHEYFGG
ncbi:MAG: DUF4160 domain-containing protein [Deltaproteobacteria bacterium]|jgi:hypothetical protein|nr:DUF4160 domain-containing protein [Deltaproteobacteria bacterium]